MYSILAPIKKMQNNFYRLCPGMVPPNYLHDVNHNEKQAYASPQKIKKIKTDGSRGTYVTKVDWIAC
jgi:hypothetical protein